MAVGVAAPAFAVSPGVWRITSASFEGNASGVRNNNATYQFRFSIDVPSGTTVTNPSASFSSTPEGNGTRITGVNPAGTVDGWNVTGSDTTGTLAGAYRSFSFTRGASIVGPATVALNFSMDDVANTDIGAAGRPFVFTSSSPATGPNTTFSVLQTNQGADPFFITSPPA